MPVTTRAAAATAQAEVKPEPRSSTPPSSPAQGESPTPDLPDVKPTLLQTGATEEEEEDGQDDTIADIKPKIVGLEPERVDFTRVIPDDEGRQHPPAAQHHHQKPPRHHSDKRTKIILQGSNDGRPYTTVVYCSAPNTMKQVKAYINKHFGYGIPKLRLLYDGRILQDSDTVACLELEDGDVIDVYLEQIGGAALVA